VRSTAWRLLVLPALVAALLAVTPAGARAEPKPPPRTTSELTLQMRDLFVARDQFDLFTMLRASAILARPTDGLQDPGGQGYSRRATEMCNHRICVHYVRGGSDAPSGRRWVRHTLRTMTAVWRHEIGELGFRRPPSDGRRGGDGRFDVYLSDLGARGLFGYCTPESQVAGEKYAASGYCVLDNDFARQQYGADPEVSLQVTAAHEFFHAIQFGYDYRADPWLMESTAVWMEESFADSANDNRRYLPYGDLAKPWVPLDRYSDTGYSQYGNWAFWQFLTDTYGDGLVRQVWDRVDAVGGAPAEASVPALSQVLNQRTHSNNGLANALAAYAVANLDPASHYPEGKAWPSAALTDRTRLRREAGSRTQTVHVDHLAARDIAFKPPVRGTPRALVVSVDAPRKRAAVVVTVRRDDGRAVSRRVVLTRGHGTTRVGFSPASVKAVVVTLVNASTRYDCHRGSLLSCGGMPLDDHEEFTVAAKVVPVVHRRQAKRG
jgi:hypothetical protein